MPFNDWFPTDRVEIVLAILTGAGTALSLALREWLKKSETTQNRTDTKEQSFIRNLLDRLDTVSKTVVERESRIDLLERKITERDILIDKLQTNLDMEEQKREALREEFQLKLLSTQDTQELYRLMFEEGPLGIGLVDIGMNFKIVNTKLCEITRRTEAELLSVNTMAITHPDDVARDTTHARQALRAPSGFRYAREKRFIAPDGAIIVTQVWVLSVTWQEKKHLLVLLDDGS